MSLKTLATLAAATGLVAASPMPMSKRNIANPFGDGFNGAFVGNFNPSLGAFNFIDGFNGFANQPQVLQIQEQNLIIDNGLQQQVVQQVEQTLIVDSVNNGFNSNLNNLFRSANFANNFADQSTVMLVVQEIQVSIDNGFGQAINQNVFAQNALVANAGLFNTQTVMVFDSRTLIANDILGNNAFGNIGQFGGIAGATGALNLLPTKTLGINLFNTKPTWSAIVADPAATLGAIWQNAILGLQNNQFDNNLISLNDQLALQIFQGFSKA